MANSTPRHEVHSNSTAHAGLRRAVAAELGKKASRERKLIHMARAHPPKVEQLQLIGQNG
jgi:hypothetical protein